MPNYCYNTILISGEGLVEFRKTMNRQNEIGEIVEFSFYQTVPRPFEENDNWFDWNVKNWGTKWDTNDDLEIRDHGDSIEIILETAWAPPTAWAKTCANKIPNLRIEIAYREPGVGFCGRCIAENDFYENIQHEFIPSDSEEDPQTTNVAA